MIARAATLLAGIAMLLSACATQGPTVGPVPDDQMILSVDNQTNRALDLFVNGSKVADLGPTSLRDIRAGQLPPLPWDAQVRLPTGRLLLELTIRSGSFVRNANGGTGPGTRVDLSCGRIDLWSGFPLMGPAPGPGVPGDCDP
jgi:hypothetical protein